MYRIPFLCWALTLVAAQEPAPSQLANMSTCNALGFADLSGFLLRLPLSSPYGRTTTVPIFLPVYATLPAGVLGDAVYENITTAVIYLHGLLGDANSYFCEGAMASAGHQGVLTLAPWFGNEQIDAAVWGAPAGEEGASAFWSLSSRWLTGGNTSPSADGESPQTRFSTAFDALDALLAALHSLSGFPNLRLITLAGFSAGAQLASRYAVASMTGTPPEPPSAAPTERIIVSNPSSLMYLDSRRPVPDCRPLRDTGADWSCNDFASPPEAPDCTDFDEYKYGVANASYQNGYMTLFDEDPAVRAAAVRRFASKDVIWIFGSLDVCNCNTPAFGNEPSCYIEGETCLPDAAGGTGCCDTAPDGLSNMVDFSCEAMVQGSNRLQRGILYTDYLQRFYEEAGEHYAQRRFFGAFAHNNSGEYASAAFQRYAFSV